MISHKEIDIEVCIELSIRHIDVRDIFHDDAHTNLKYSQAGRGTVFYICASVCLECTVPGFATGAVSHGFGGFGTHAAVFSLARRHWKGLKLWELDRRI